MSKKKVTAPLSYDPGKGRPKEFLAYLNWQEMQALQRLNGGNMEFGPRGLPSFPPADAEGSNQTPGTGNWTGAPGGPTGGGSPGGDVGSSTESGNISGGATASSTASTAASSTTSAASQNTTDTNAQQAAAVNNAVNAAGSSALTEDAKRAGIGSIEVGPMRTPVQIGGGQVFGSLSRVASGSYGLSAPDVIPSQTAGIGSVPVPRMNPLNDPSKFIQQERNVFSGVNPVALSKIVRLQEEFGAPLTITSGFRSPSENVQRGGAKKSQHIHGNAIDIAIPGASASETARLIDTASGVGFTGIGGYRPGKVHVDVAGTRVWGPSYGKESISRLPSSMREALRAHQAGLTPKINIDYASLERQPSPTFTPSTETAAQNLTPETQFAGVENSYNPGVLPDPIASATMAALTRLPSALSGLSIPSIPEASFVDRMKIAAAKVKLGPEGFQSEVNKRVAGALEGTGFSLPGAISSGIGALNRMAAPATEVAGQPEEQQIAGVENGNVGIPTERTDFVLGEEEQNYPKYVSPERQALIADQEKKNRIGVKVIERAPFVGGIASIGEGLTRLFTGEDIADQATNMKYAFEQMSPEQQAEAIAKYPDMRRYAVSAGIIPPSSGNQYAYSGTPEQELGGKNYEQSYASYAPQYSGSYQYQAGPEPVATINYSLAKKYRRWDRGIGIPSPGDPDYNEYQDYLEERGSSAEV